MKDRRVVRAIAGLNWFADDLKVSMLSKVGNKYPDVERFHFDGEAWQLHDPQSMVAPDGSLNMSKEAAQELVDSLWLCGIRPNEAKGSAGQLSAVEKHLNDMRAIVSKELEVKL